MSNTPNNTTQDVSQDPGIHPSGLMDQNNNNITNTPNFSHITPPSFNNTNSCPQNTNFLSNTFTGDSLNQQILIPKTCHVATQNI